MYIYCVSAHAAFACLQLDWATTTGDCLAPPPVCHTKIEASVKCLAQGHNKQACRLVRDTIPIVLSAKQESCKYHFLKSFGVTQLGK